MSEPPKWMQNPYLISSIPSVSPVHLKRRSESTSANKSPLPSNSSKRPSTSGSTSHSSLEVGTSASSPAATAKVKYPYTVLTRGKKHHAYPRDLAPYPLNYESRLLDYDALDSIGSSSSPSLVHQFVLSDRTTHPRKVLDIGCGNGAWCIRAASLWPETTFVGLDLVAIQPDPYALERIAATRKGSKAGFKQSLEPPPSRKSTSSQGTARLPPLAPNSIYNRIKWVHHNFLTKRLPFKDDEFDLVRVRGIAQGVPEDEVSVLKFNLFRPCMGVHQMSFPYSLPPSRRKKTT
ncbi:hypothetical protein M408DRAFT_287458 [Serendipita vermifera MAFF 305830]|uniref:Methyltransferase domain-containing protein n=1 Tax=Serendipita vermifera MAFF 305830 TaxID=933852 RepID=A0A0C3BGF8_SERVB|nr:hypothetical protein M408DRAFT_146288 [Serendipita vermifera MAFF 305830]KIM30551.1 hypothetical protein M408DRAFT_287458 [Serendipita vermifera MAFF 305830]